MPIIVVDHMSMIPYGRQDTSEADIQAVVDVLRSDFLTQGPAVPVFEKAVAEYCGADYAVAVNSASSGGLGSGYGRLSTGWPETLVRL